MIISHLSESTNSLESEIPVHQPKTLTELLEDGYRKLGVYQGRIEFINDTRPEDEVWEVRINDTGNHKKTNETFDFRIPTAPGPVLISDPVHAHDLLTVKLCLASSLDAHSRVRTNSGGVARRRHAALVDLIRWRTEVGLSTMNQITRPWFDLFVKQLKRETGNGRWELLPYKTRVDDLLENVRFGKEYLPIDDLMGSLKATDVARRLGLSSRLQLPDAEWFRILDYLGETDPAALRRTLRMPREDMSWQPRIGVGSLNFTSAMSILHPFEWLWDLRELLAHDPIGFRAFDFTLTRSKLAKTLTTKEMGRTLLPPPDQVAWLIDGALRLVISCEGHCRQLHKIVAEAYANFPGCSVDKKLNKADSAARHRYIADYSDPVLQQLKKELNIQDAIHPVFTFRSRNGFKKDKITIRDILRFILPAACGVIIAAFTARRHSEIVNLKTGCVFENEFGDPLLTVWIAKTLRDVDNIPIPKSVVVAVDMLEWLSESARADGRDSPWLFTFQEPSGSTPSGAFDLSESLKMLARFVGVPALPDGEVWDWKPHQFRTFFSVTYFWRFDYPSLTALSDFLRHFNPTMTHMYVTRVVKGRLLKLLEEKEVNKQKFLADEQEAMRVIREQEDDFKTAQEKFLLAVAKEVVVDGEKLGGRGGEAWTRELNALMAQAEQHIQFSPKGRSDDALDSVLRPWCEGKRLDPHPRQHAYCKCGTEPEDLLSAACLLAKRKVDPTFGSEQGQEAGLMDGPDYAHATESTCAGCVHGVQRKKANLPYHLSALAEAEKAERLGVTEAERARGRARANFIRATVARSFPTYSGGEYVAGG